MHILHITTYMQGGSGKILLNLLLEQLKASHQVSLLISHTCYAPDYFHYPEYLKAIQEANIHCIQVDSTFKRDLEQNIQAVLEVKNLHLQTPIDLIHTHAAIPSLIGIMASENILGCNISVIQTMHGFGIKKKIFEEMDIAIMNMKTLKRVVTVSLSDKSRLLEKGVFKEKLATIPCGIEESTPKPYSNPLVDEISSFKALGYKIIGCIGTVCIRKNQSLLIDACHLLKHKANLPPFLCIFLGEGELIPSLQEKVSQLNLEKNVKFLGYQEDPILFLSLFDCLVLPSLKEGLPLTILEAFQQKIPVIASDIPQLKELIEEGKTGYLFPLESAEALANTLEKVLTSSKETLEMISHLANHLYRTSYTAKQMAKRYQDLYRDIL